MTGIERLRELAEGAGADVTVWMCVDEPYGSRHGLSHADEGGPIGGLLRDIADQIERDLTERSELERDMMGDTVENVRLIVGGVIADMERHVLGHEGMDDSPVARWARELRAALGCADEADEDRDAIAWVREHGGLSHVKDIFHDFRAVVERLGIEWSESELHGLMDVLDKRLMPEGMEWPRDESGEFVKFGDELEHYEQGHRFKVDGVEFMADGWRACHESGGVRDVYRPGERVRRPAPKVLDADRAEIREGDTVWGLQSAKAYAVDGFVVDGSHGEYTVDAHYVIGLEQVYLMPSQLTHRAPVLAGDGKPLREGETVWGTGREQHEYVVLGQPGRGGGIGRFKVACHDVTDGIDCDCDPSQLTHERPDSYDALWEDIEACAVGYEGFMRRAKALAERDA